MAVAACLEAVDSAGRAAEGLAVRVVAAQVVEEGTFAASIRVSRMERFFGWAATRR